MSLDTYLCPQATTETFQEVLGATVDGPPCPSSDPSDARHVDDVALLPLHHARQHCRNAVQAATDVDVDHLVPALLVHVHHVLPNGQTRVVHQDIYRAQLTTDLSIDHPLIKSYQGGSFSLALTFCVWPPCPSHPPGLQALDLPDLQFFRQPDNNVKVFRHVIKLRFKERTWSSRVLSLPTSPTRPPDFAKTSETAAPIPLEAPVTTITFPVRDMLMEIWKCKTNHWVYLNLAIPKTCFECKLRHCEK